jgi:mannose-6-phosphate isomerase-like protein (cupin superfamily)
MDRQNFLNDEPWDEVHGDKQIRTRMFERPLGAMLGASLHELLPGSPGFSLHMHYGAEEMFFVVSGTPTLRNEKTEEQLSPGDVVYCPEGIDGLHTFMNPTNEPARLLATSRAASLTSSRIRSRGTHGWRPATRNSPRRRSATRGSLRASSCRPRNDGRRQAFS